MKKLITMCSADTPGCVSANENRYIVEKEYTDEMYNTIRAQADKYEILVYSNSGYDYGYGRSDSSTSTSRKSIPDHRIVVSRDGTRFVGVTGESDYYSFNKVSNIHKGMGVALCSDPVDSFKGYVVISKTGSSFSSDDHEKWDYTTYYLKKK